MGPEGDLYVAEFGADKVARVIPASVSPGTSEGITELAAKGQPLLVSAASDGAVWFTEPANDQLLRFDPKTETSTLVGSANGVTGDATGVAEDGAGHLWFTQFKTAAIGVLQAGGAAQRSHTGTWARRRRRHRWGAWHRRGVCSDGLAVDEGKQGSAGI